VEFYIWLLGVPLRSSAAGDVFTSLIDGERWNVKIAQGSCASSGRGAPQQRPWLFPSGETAGVCESTRLRAANDSNRSEMSDPESWCGTQVVLILDVLRVVKHRQQLLRN